MADFLCLNGGDLEAILAQCEPEPRPFCGTELSQGIPNSTSKQKMAHALNQFMSTASSAGLSPVLLTQLRVDPLLCN